MMRWFTFILTVCCAVGASRANEEPRADSAGAQDVPKNAGAPEEPIDRERVRMLFRKKNQGKQLTGKEQAYLDRGMGGAARKKPAPATRPVASTPTFRPIVSAEACPILGLSIVAKDGAKPVALLRKPPGAGPFPAVVYFHGGSASLSRAQLEAELQGQTLSRFLRAGYIVVAGTYRPIRRIDEAINDGVAIVEHVKTIPGVDPKSVAVWGDSAGGSLAFDIAARVPVAAIAAMEPATILFARVGLGADRMASVTDPKSVYTDAARDYTRAKIRKIEAPIFLAHGDVHPINHFNSEITIPEMKAENRCLEVKLYPGENHGFSRRAVATLDAPKRFFEDADAFFRHHLATKPTPVPATTITDVPVQFDRRRSADPEEK